MQIHPLLQPYHWENRLLIIFSPEEKNSSYVEQLDIFENNQVDIRERDLVIFRILSDSGFTPQEKQLSQQEAESLRKHFKIKDDYQMLLIGKDGGVKQKFDEAVKMQQINSLIDAMPMRRQEMKNNR